MIFYLWKWIVARIDVDSSGGGLPRRYAPRNEEINDERHRECSVAIHKWTAGSGSSLLAVTEPK